MFPFVYGFEWSFGHVLFVGIFLAVALVVTGTLGLAAWRSFRDLRQHRAGHIQWHGQFHELSQSERACRHALTRVLPDRVCNREFECGHCDLHAHLSVDQAPVEPGIVELLGMPVPLDRLYHRGHTWVKMERDGSLLIGLDEMGRRIVGRPDLLELPRKGEKLETNVPAFRLERHGSEVRILAPVDGEVIDVAEPGEDWLVRVRPAQQASLTHLLRNREVHAWYLRELERLQMVLSPADGPALADGGVLVEDISEACPRDRWDTLCGEIFLDV